MKHYQHSLYITLLFVVLSALPVSTLDAREFRGISSITTPNSPLPEGATRPETLEPIDLKVIEQAVYDLAKAWNGEGLSGLISNDFANLEQLLLVVTNDVPRNAKMRVLSIQSIQTLDQYEQEIVSAKTPAFDQASCISSRSSQNISQECQRFLSIVMSSYQRILDRNEPARAIIVQPKNFMGWYSDNVLPSQHSGSKQPVPTVVRTSTVTATARTAIEFTDSVTGFQRLEGVNEFQFRVVEEFK